jgi:Radical SAM N-terminal
MRVASPRFLPTCRADLDARGWDQLDIIVVSGDAYVDHPAFGPVLIARFLEGRGFKVGVLAQPDWRSAEPFRALGRPRLFFGVSAGNLDSMLNRLTAQKKNRSEDQYSPGGRTGCRPDRATVVYAQRCREAYPGVPIVLGGIEASLRRIAHYDYWSDTVRRSMLLDAKADLLVFGMGERPVWEVADRLSRGERIGEIRDVRGTALPINDAEMKRHEADPARMVADRKTVVLPSYEAVATDKRAFALMSRAVQLETNPGNARPLAQRHGQRGVYYNPPAFPLEDGAGSGGDAVSMDELYDLPFTRTPHPMYTERIPGYETVKHSLVLMRGCFGGSPAPARTPARSSTTSPTSSAATPARRWKTWWSWPSGSRGTGGDRARCRTSSPRRWRWRPGCTTRASTRSPCNRSTPRPACGPRSFRSRCCSTGVPSSGRSPAKRSARPAAPTSSAAAPTRSCPPRPRSLRSPARRARASGDWPS